MLKAGENNAVVDSLITLPISRNGLSERKTFEHLRDSAVVALGELAGHLGVSPLDISDCKAQNYLERIWQDGVPKERQGFGALVIHCALKADED